MICEGSPVYRPQYTTFGNISAKIIPLRIAAAWDTLGRAAVMNRLAHAHTVLHTRPYILKALDTVHEQLSGRQATVHNNCVRMRRHL